MGIFLTAVKSRACAMCHSEVTDSGTYKDTIRFLFYAKGSCAELRTQIYIGIDIGYVDKKVGNIWIKETTEISKMLQGLIAAFNDS